MESNYETSEDDEKTSLNGKHDEYKFRSSNTVDNSTDPSMAGPLRSRIKHVDQLFSWHGMINRQIRIMTKSGISQKKLLSLMETYIKLLKTNSKNFILNANRCSILAKAMSTAMFLFKDLNKSTESHEYLLKICELLSFYTFLELKFSSKFNSSKIIIAERIIINYDIHLRGVDVYYILRVFLNIPALFNQKEVMSKIFQKYLICRSFCKREISDKLYCMYLLAFSQWMSLETDNFEKVKICDYANQYMKPMKSLCSNKTYAPFLPVYDPNDPNATKVILSNRINISHLTRVLKKTDYSKETIIDLCENDVTETPLIVDGIEKCNDTPETTLNSIKLETPVIIASIDLTEENTSWETDWLSKLLRKSRDVLPLPNAIVTSNNQPSAIINIDDDDDENNIDSSSNEMIVTNVEKPDNSQNQKIIDKIDIKIVNSSNKTVTNEIFENIVNLEKVNESSKENLSSKCVENSLFNDVVFPVNTGENQDQARTCNIQESIDKLNISEKGKQIEEDELSDSDSSCIRFKRPLKTYERKKTFNGIVNKSVENISGSQEESVVFRILSDVKLTPPLKHVENINSHPNNVIFSTSNNLYKQTSVKDNSNRNNSQKMLNFCNNDAEIAEETEISSPPVESFSKSDADEIVQLIDKHSKKNLNNTLQPPCLRTQKDSYRAPERMQNYMNKSIDASNSVNVRKVTFADLPEKHIAMSNRFSPKQLRPLNSKESFEATFQTTSLPSINTSITTLSNSQDINQQNNNLRSCFTDSSNHLQSTIQNTLPSIKNGSLPTVSATIGSLFLMKFPQPTFRKTEVLNFEHFPSKKSEIGSRKNSKQTDKITFGFDKKHMSDFDKYLEKLKEKRNKVNNKVPEASPSTPKVRVRHKKANKKNKSLNLHYDTKLYSKCYVQIDKLDFTQFNNKIHCLSSNAYVRVKRLRISKTTQHNSKSKQNIESTAIANQSESLELSEAKPSTQETDEKLCNEEQFLLDKLLLDTNSENEKNSEDNRIPEEIIVNKILNHCPENAVEIPRLISDTEISLNHEEILKNNAVVDVRGSDLSSILDESRNILSNQNILNESDVSSLKMNEQIENFQIETSQAEVSSISNSNVNEQHENQQAIGIAENEVSSTQDRDDVSDESKVSSSQDVSTKDIHIQNHVIDTSNRSGLKPIRKRKISLESGGNTNFSKTPDNIANMNEGYFCDPNSFVQSITSETHEPNVSTTTEILKRKKGSKKKITSDSNAIRKSQLIYSNMNENLIKVSKTYSKHNVVENIFVPTEIEKCFESQ